MKIEEVRKLPPTERFLYWFKERHRIYLKRTQGEPPPWTDDEVLQSYYFTNPYREHDKTTVWFRETVREPLRDDPRVIFATIAFRWFNLIRTGEVLMSGRKNLLLSWDPGEALRRLDPLRDRGDQIFTGAFIINSPGGETKLNAIVRRVSQVWDDRKTWEKELKTRGRDLRMEEACAVLTRYEGLGGFMAYEVVCDLRYTSVLEHSPDKMTWCNPGPGCIRGLYRIAQEDFPNGQNSGYPSKPKDWLSRMEALLRLVRQRLKGYPPIEMREIEHSLCEYDKYMRAVDGDGQLKRLYRGGV